MSHIQLNYAFLLFWSIFGVIYRELLLLVQKVTTSEKSTETLRKFVFLNKFKKGQIQRKLWICLNNFFDQTSKLGQILTKNCFSPQSEPQTDKLYFSVVLKHFFENSQRTSLFSQKLVISERSMKNSESWFFLTCLKSGKSWEKFGFV